MSSIRRINCENCSAPYAINVSTLKKEKNTVTCRRCKHKMLVYRSGFSEPDNEQARVVLEDEKTLIDEPKAQEEMPVLDTEISTKPPPLSLSPKAQSAEADDLENRFDQTARPEDFVPLHSRQDLNQNLKGALSEDSTAPRPRHDISPRASSARPELGKAGKAGKADKMGQKSKVEDKFTKASPQSANAGNAPAGLSMMLTVVAAMIFMAMLSSFGQYYVQDEITQKIALVVSVSSLMLAFFLVLTSSFGKKASSMLVSIGLSALTTIALGAGLFMVGNNPNDTASSNEAKTELVAKNAESEKPEQPEQVAILVGNTEQDKNEKDNSKKERTSTRINSSSENKASDRSSPRSINSSNSSSSKTVAEAVNPRIEAPEPSLEMPLEEDKKIISDPIEEDLPDDLDLGDMDLDSDDGKKSRFGRKEKQEKKEDKPAPKLEAVKKESSKATTKVEIPQSVMDIIIRNNKDVKGCYVSHRAEHGDFPKKVEVLFTLQPSGKVSQAYIAEGPHVGSKFESCLRSAFKKMTFPAFDSSASPQSLRYTLKI